MVFRQPRRDYIVIFCIVLGLFVSSTLCVGQEVAEGQHFRDSLHRHISVGQHASLSCYFTYAQGQSVIMSSLGDNASELSRLDAFVRQAVDHPEWYVNRVRLTGYSSIEGRYSVNDALSRDRVWVFYRYLREHYPSLSPYPHDVAWVAEDWRGLASYVRQSQISEREEILEIIRKVSNFDKRETLLVKLNGGRVYSKLLNNIFPKLRRVEIEVEYGRTPYSNPNLEATLKEIKEEPDSSTLMPPIPLEIKEDSVPVVNLEDSVLVVNDEDMGSKTLHPSSPRFAIKTNVLQWIGVQPDLTYTTPVANVALEYYVNSKFSIELGAMYSYWRYNSNQKFQGISGYRLEPRYNSPVWGDRFGTYLGIYGRVGDYDTWEYTGDYWDAGLSTGVTIHLIDGFGLEVGARAGYVSTKAIKYTRDGDYNWYDSERKYNKLRVTDLNVSLIYRFR